ncbi:DUF4843 domain-containing protein [Butyricimonas paravirosa]|uniref:DUF4843 domain-containing protein n=1 Tax=Butyricimonas paravirosa TaxID=1472417 RepID=UPI00210CF3AB|nr:DUF4843 domain-containing protein [Butyricimonas paravirosa]MCQ4873173.1 DUF4843 domain-containing protein [Butyricimonas paravirosa]
MKRIFILFILAVLCSCSKNDRLVYDSGMHDIYYPVVKDGRDSVFVSLLTADGVLTTTVDVKLLGETLLAPAKFKVEVVKEKTDAVEGVHYEKLPEYYEFPAGEFVYKMPVNLIKGDKGITEEAVSLTLRLVGTSDLGVAYVDRAEIRLIIADMVKMPEGTGYYGDMTAFKKLFGEYSRKKHEMIIEMTGHDFWDGNYGSYGGVYGIAYEMEYYTPYARKLYKIITQNEIKDENGNIMQGWMVP